jgi:hypothetical protein
MPVIGKSKYYLPAECAVKVEREGKENAEDGRAAVMN